MSDRTNDHVTAQMLLGGRYLVESELGRGGMATVFKGTDTVLGRPVAVKVLSPQYAGDANFVTRFRREAQSAARLNHPNLVSVYDTGTDDGIRRRVMRTPVDLERRLRPLDGFVLRITGHERALPGLSAIE